MSIVLPVTLSSRISADSALGRPATINPKRAMIHLNRISQLPIWYAISQYWSINIILLPLLAIKVKLIFKNFRPDYAQPSDLILTACIQFSQSANFKSSYSRRRIPQPQGDFFRVISICTVDSTARQNSSWRWDVQDLAADHPEMIQTRPRTRYL